MRALPFALLVFSGTALANDLLTGQWRLSLEQNGRPIEALLEFRTEASSLVAYVEGSPVRMSVQDNTIEMAIDDRSLGGEPYERYLTGTISPAALSGTYGPENPVDDRISALCEMRPLACPAPTGKWTAAPYDPEYESGSEPEPVDLSGNWRMSVGFIRRQYPDLTDAGDAWNRAFDVKLDLPAQRCQSAGLVSGWGFRGNDPEIFQSDDVVVMILGNEVRRIYLDDRQPPEFAGWFPLGFSSGRWEGSTLVVTTTHLQPSTRGLNGDPVSENAVVTERYWIDGEGRLAAEMRLTDPEYYHDQPLRRARWSKSASNAVRFPTLCDPDSFYRQLDGEGLLDEYWSRSSHRY